MKGRKQRKPPVKGRRVDHPRPAFVLARVHGRPFVHPMRDTKFAAHRDGPVIIREPS